MNKSGVIYILTNPSFPEYVKIGYADDIEKRLQQLNRSECTPFAFRVYATYETPSRLSDLKIHSIIDKLNPDLRSIDNVKGQKRIREFYAMSAEDALFRTTEYEIACINSLYYKASMISCTGLKAFLYDLIGKKARMQKIVLWMPDIDISYNDQAFSGLAESLKLYYLAYSRFTIDKDKLFSEKLIDIVKEFMDYSKHNDSQEEYV